MTTLAPLTSSSRAQSSLVASSEASTTARDIDAADERGDDDDDDDDESEDDVDIVDSYQPHDEECICDYDQQTESRFDFTLIVINFLNH